jgi:hypothetical protein
MNEANFKKEAQMSLAQVAYTISTDADFAAKWNEDPQTALAGKGFELSQEEFDFLANGLRKGIHQKGGRVNLSDLVLAANSWR